MLRSRWLRRAGPGIVALGAVVVLASTTLGARDRPWDPPDCAAVRGETGLLPPVGRGADALAPDEAPWFRLDPVIDGAGALSGQRLVIGRAGGASRRTLLLPAESFAAGPFGSVVLVGSDDGTTSRLAAVDVVAGCSSSVATSTDVIRRATISPDWASIVEFRVDRHTRADLGTWHRSLGRTDRATRVLAPIESDARFGRTWATEFTWADDGSLAVESCGEISCRTRVLDSAWRPAGAMADPALGATIGLADGRLVSYLACRGLPCPIVVTDLSSGRRRTLVTDGGSAVVTSTAAGVRLVHTRDVGHGRTLGSVALDGSHRVDLGSVPAGFDLQAAPSRALAGIVVPPGWAVLAPDGRMPLDRTGPAATLRQVLDGRSATLGEVLP